MGEHFEHLIGESVLRLEDRPLLRGQGQFIDDLNVPHMLEAAFLRSTLAHGRITKLDVTVAQQAPHVHAVFTYHDLRPFLTSDRIPLALPAAGIQFDVDPFVLAYDEVCYVGEPIAIVIASHRRYAEDALQLIDLEIEPLDVVVDPVLGLQPNSPRTRLDTPHNLVARTGIDYGNADACFTSAPHIISQRFRLAKGGGHSMEPRGVLAVPNSLENTLTVWDSTQMPHRARAILVESLGMSEKSIRVVTPDVGGGFGPKAVFHPEELAVPLVSLILKQPVKWVEDRFESFTATVLEHEQEWDMQIAFDNDGKMQAIKGRLCYDHGASTPYGIALPFNAATNLIGPYVLPAYKLQIDLCLTNKTPAAPTRGAGRPQGTFVMERLLDRIAAYLQLSRDEVRRRNLIQPEQLPFAIPVRQRDGSTMSYDSGNYPACQARVMDIAHWDEFKTRQKAALEQGRYIGIGLCNYVEATGRGPFESVSISIGPSGKISVGAGATAQGQGVKTMVAQIIADTFQMNPEFIDVVVGDTAATPSGLGAYASRQAVTAGNAALEAAQRVIIKAKIAAAALLEVSVDDLCVRDGKICVAGIEQRNLSLKEIAKALAGTPGFAIPGHLTPGLAATSDFMTQGLTYTNGAHIAEVEVDIHTGAVNVLRYYVVHDCGNMINPMMVEGQVRGGVVHGIGMTLFEWMRYDAQGQPLTSTYADYLLPTADVCPDIIIDHMISPTPLNPLGVKGAAESGTIGVPAALVSAIENALEPFDVTLTQLPITPNYLRSLIRQKTDMLI
jgi:aerobic carbon-monoxide dehydrogenase large subunit